MELSPHSHSQDEPQTHMGKDLRREDFMVTKNDKNIGQLVTSIWSKRPSVSEAVTVTVIRERLWTSASNCRRDRHRGLYEYYDLLQRTKNILPISDKIKCY
jgi:hypothetical protein